MKSSQNTISLPDVKTWAQELEASITADEYEIRLIGPVSQGVTTLVSHGKVQVPNPQPLDLNGLVYQAAHQLDHYLQSRQLGVQHPSMREMAVQALVTRLSVFSTSGTPLERAAFDALLKSWIGKIAENTVLPPTGWSHTLPDEFKPLVRLDLTTPPPISQHVARSPDGQFWLVHWDSPNRLFRWDKITEDYAANALQHVARYRNVSDWRDLFRE